ncbi:MAG: pyridoxal-phosphate dependent enzyme [Deltaproteobacteria bacterium]|nr:pyridoxal-phosphate dependent enzyme [Deltaproteobacteria bacterium]
MSKAKGYPSLFKYYPELDKKLPWVRLASLPTPVQKLHHLGFDNLWVKRDDHSSPVYGGNKVRKLEFLLADAKKKNRKRVITFGAIGTNHGLATAIFSRNLGLDCTLLLFWQPVTGNVKQNLRLFKKYHAKTMYKKTMLNTVISFFVTQRIRHPGAYFIFAGGSSHIGTLGFVNAAFELRSQIEQGLMPEPAVIFCPTGSNGTAAGLHLGTLLAGLNTKVVGVRVTESHFGPLQTCTGDSIQKLAKSAYHYLRSICGSLPDIKINSPTILGDYFGDGYGYATEKGKKAYHLLKKKENIILDPTYTSKAFAAVLDYCKGHADNSKPVLYWHTYNSVDMSGQAESVDYRLLPKNLWKFIEEDGIAF